MHVCWYLECVFLNSELWQKKKNSKEIKPYVDRFWASDEDVVLYKHSKLQALTTKGKIQVMRSIIKNLNHFKLCHTHFIPLIFSA